MILSSESCSLGKATIYLVLEGKEVKGQGKEKGEGEADPPVPRFDSRGKKNLTAHNDD